MTFREALRAAMERLRESGADTPDRDARALLLWSSGLDPAALIVREREGMPETGVDAYAAAISRRMAGEPVARIIGSRAFYGRDFIVTPDVLDPRADSETLIDAALETARATGAPEAPRILDLGTGTGCLLLSLLDQLPLATGLGIDLSHEALAVARQNAERLQLNKKAEFRHSNWLEKVDETFDLVVCNPPYIGAHEGRDLPREVLDWDPALALFAEKGGLAAYECIALGLSDVLSRAGTGFFEVGYEQADAVARIFADAGFREIAFRADLSGTRRCVIVR